MIDQTAIVRDARACIADWPATLRHYYSPTQYDQVTVGINATDDVSDLLDGGLLDKPQIEVTAIAQDFVNGLPKNRDRVDLLIGGNWVQLEIKRTPDAYDPLQTTYSFRIGTKNA